MNKKKYNLSNLLQTIEKELLNEVTTSSDIVGISSNLFYWYNKRANFWNNKKRKKRKKIKIKVL